MAALPLDVECARCGAGVGRGCHTGTGYAAKTHVARWRAVGISEPDGADRQRDYEDSQRRRLERIEAAYKRPAWLK